jgi:hypothetical protein
MEKFDVATFSSSPSPAKSAVRKGEQGNVSGALLAAALAVLVGILSPIEAICANQGQALTNSIAELKAKAGTGTVRVIARLHPDPRAAPPTNAKETEHAIAQSQAALVNALRQEGAAVAEPIIGQPFVVLELTAPQLDRLMATGLVESIEEDRIGGTYSK